MNVVIDVRARGRAVAVGGALGLTVLGILAVLAVLDPSRPSDTSGAGSGPSGPAAGWGITHNVRHTDLAGARVWRLPAGGGVMMPAAAPDGSVWIAEMTTNTLVRLDPQRDVVQQFRFPGGPRETMGVAVSSEGRVWLAQERAMSLGMFDPRIGRYREFAIPGGVSAPVGLAIASDGDVWFTEMSGDRIGRFDPRTERFTQYRVPTPDAAPYGLAIAPHGRVWFTEFGAGRVGVLDATTGRIREYAVPGRPNIPAVAVASDGAVWFTSTQGSVYRLSQPTGALHRIPLPAAGDYGIAVGPDGRLWVGRNGGRTVYAVQPGSGRIRSRRLPPGSAPWWPTVDPRGHIWLALAGAASPGLAELDP